MALASRLLRTCLATPTASQRRTGWKAVSAAGRRLVLSAAFSCYWSPTPLKTKVRTKLSASSRPAAPTGRRENDMKKSAKRTTASVLTAAQRREIAALVAPPDDTIDYSGIPPLTERFWESAVRNPFYRPVKQQLTVRLAADVIAWLRRQGEGYQTRLNGLLRSAMLKDLKKTP